MAKAEKNIDQKLLATEKFGNWKTKKKPALMKELT
jgi:hypothetical protein